MRCIRAVSCSLAVVLIAMPALGQTQEQPVAPAETDSIPVAPAPAPAPSDPIVIGSAPAEQAPAVEPASEDSKEYGTAPTGKVQDAAADAEQTKEKEEVGDGKKKTFKVKGRVFVLGALLSREALRVSSAGVPENTTITSLDLLLQSARVGFEYRSPLEWLTAEVEAELTGRPEVKDAFARAKQKHWDVKVGQFKMPIGSFEMDSPWDLPFVHRGFVNELLVDNLDVAGRRPGITVGVRAGGALKPGLTVGAFQGSQLTAQTADDRDVELIEAQGTDSQTEIARAHIKSKELELGVSYQHRLGAPALGKTRHFWTTGVDLMWEHLHAGGGLRVWGDFMAGESWYEHASKPPDNDDAVFTAARALVAYRFGGVERRDLYVEPFLYGAAHDPDTDVVADQAFEAMLGVAGGFWDQARLVLQAEIVKARRNFPSGYSVGTDPDRLALLLQAGVSF